MRQRIAKHLRESGYDMRTVQDLLGHENVSTAMVSLHLLSRGGKRAAALDVGSVAGWPLG